MKLKRAAREIEMSLADKLITGMTMLKDLAPRPFRFPKKKTIKRVLHRIVSDNHIGSNIDGRETGGASFGYIEESRRTAALAVQVADYKTRYRDHTSLVIHEIGDGIQNQLHDPRDGAALAEQCIRYINLRTQDILFHARHFCEVDVYCSPGNHGRFTSRHREKAVDQKWDSLETVLFYAVAAACRNQSNVRFHIPYTPYCAFKSLNHNYFSTHGDTILSIGSPNRSIDIRRAEAATNKWNSRLDGDQFAVFTIGHVHVATSALLPNGSRIVTNGALCPADPFAISINIPESACSQTLWEATEKYPIGDMRVMQVGIDEDRDASLDIYKTNNLEEAREIL